ncbi:hypothetical protein SAMN06264348_1056 [Oceanospirillum linum]|nr:hypothetical protein SAMN04489856_1067 [Oleiphilus messinensis]SMP23924.1 hypothetical protein SAMN06264348_1056 [Oceanospirillum linum]
MALEGITIGGKTLREHFEAINHRDAILMVEEWVEQQQPMNEWGIKNLHQLVLKNIDNDNARRYRDVNVLNLCRKSRRCLPTLGFRHWPATQ